MTCVAGICRAASANTWIDFNTYKCSDFIADGNIAAAAENGSSNQLDHGLASIAAYSYSIGYIQARIEEDGVAKHVLTDKEVQLYARIVAGTCKENGDQLFINMLREFHRQ